MYFKNLDKYKTKLAKLIYSFTSKIKNFLNKNTNIFIYLKKKNTILNPELILDGVNDRKSAFLELAIYQEISNGWNGLIQIGAGGPEKADFLEKFVIKYNLESYFIDGDKRTLDQKSKRINKKIKNNSKYINKWISAESEQRIVYKFANQNDNLSGFTSLSKEDFIINAESNKKEKLINEKVNTTGIIDITKKYCNNKISLLALDCEGLDFEILQKLIKNRIFPQIFVVEILSFNNHEIEYLKNKLIENRYIIFPDISDIIAVKKNL